MIPLATDAKLHAESMFELKSIQVKFDTTFRLLTETQALAG